MQILQCITVQSSGNSPIKNKSKTKTLVKDKFKSFNSQFEELRQRQCQWIVPDIELRESLRLAIAEILLPSYKSFLKRFGYIQFKNTFNQFRKISLCGFLSFKKVKKIVVALSQADDRE